MLSYDKQLGLKRNVVVKAYRNFSGLPESSVPEIQSTIGSPLQYGYRTKITPHFEVSKKKKDEELRIGFNKINTKIPIDIEVWLSSLSSPRLDTHASFDNVGVSNCYRCY